MGLDAYPGEEDDVLARRTLDGMYNTIKTNLEAVSIEMIGRILGMHR